MLVAAQAPTTTVGRRRTWAIKSAGTTTVTTRLGKSEVMDAIHTRTLTVDDSGSASIQPFPECTYTQNPCSITDWIEVGIDGKPMTVRSDGIAGLGDMGYLSVSGLPRAWCSPLKGRWRPWL